MKVVFCLKKNLFNQISLYFFLCLLSTFFLFVCLFFELHLLLSCRIESQTLHWICPVLWKAHDIHSPSYMATAVMMLSPTQADIFHCGKMVPTINPITPRSARENPRICRPELAICASSFFDDLPVPGQRRRPPAAEVKTAPFHGLHQSLLLLSQRWLLEQILDSVFLNAREKAPNAP